MFQNSPFGGCTPARRLLVWAQALSVRAQGHGGQAMKYPLPFGVLVILIALTLSACGGGASRGGEDQQARGRPLPKYEKASLPAGRYHTTESPAHAPCSSTKMLPCPPSATTPPNSTLPSRSASPETTGGSKAPRGHS